MPLFRNVTPIPLEGLPEGRQVLPYVDIELDEATMALPLIDAHLKQRALVPVTMATETPRRSASARTTQED